MPVDDPGRAGWDRSVTGGGVGLEGGVGGVGGVAVAERGDVSAPVRGE